MADETTTRRSPHPAIWLVLYLPYGITNGYVTVTLAWLLSHAGASVAAVAGLAGLALAPNTWKVLWAPLVDVSLTAKRWFVIANLATAATLAPFAFLPLTVAMLPAFGWLVLINSIAGSVTAIATNRMMAYDTTDADKGRAGGWSQAGNLGGVGLGGGAGLWIAQHTGHPWLAAAFVAAACLLCTFALAFPRDPPSGREGPGYLSVLIETGRDVWSLVQRRIGLLACFLMLLPIGSGSAQNLFAAIAKDWGASADLVALIGGVLQGVVGIVGCVIGGYVCDRMDRKRAYLLFGAVMAGASLAMALGPHTPWAFLVFASLYNLTVGLSYGAYSAVSLEAIGQGAAATKFNLISSISNVPLLVVVLVDGWAQTRWGSSGMLIGETILGLAGIALYALVAWATRGLTWSRVFGRRAAAAG
ncbi:MAG: MFS transporter [Alphaproteobacteria bacterium]|nr:MFS transporter [Alphaproteobacteria bacterium]